MKRFYLFMIILFILSFWRIMAWTAHLWEIDHPTVTYDCKGQGKPVFINGEFVDCTGRPQDHNNIYYAPNHGILDMADIEIPDDSYLDGEKK